MTEEVYQKATIKSMCIDACKNTTCLFVSGESNEAAYKSIDLLIELDEEFRHKLMKLFVETQKRLQEEFNKL